jgi:hypothetical protein
VNTAHQPFSMTPILNGATFPDGAEPPAGRFAFWAQRDANKVPPYRDNVKSHIPRIHFLVDKWGDTGEDIRQSKNLADFLQKFHSFLT